MVELLFWLCVFAVFYSYFIYPGLLSVVGAKQRHNSTHQAEYPSVDVILSAYNEADCIEQRINNLLEQNYPGQLRILVASDGSSDDTGDIISRFDNEQVNATVFQLNRGKISVLNELVQSSDADVLVFTDANTEFCAGAIEALATSFTEGVGAVCGELHLVAKKGHTNKDSLYWRYEQFIKSKESDLGALLGANGGIYAIKRELYQELPSNTVVDDFCIAMNVKKQGFDVIYNQAAKALEEVSPTLKEEYGRRVRIGLGNYRALRHNLWALNPFSGLVSWAFWSHKVLRWFAPHCLILIFVLNLLLLATPLYAAIFVLQLAFYAISYLGYRYSCNNKPLHPVIAIATFFTMMNLALFQGFIRFLEGKQGGSWKSTERSS